MIAEILEELRQFAQEQDQKAITMRGLPNDISAQSGYAGGLHEAYEFMKEHLAGLETEAALVDKTMQIQQELIIQQQKVIEIQTRLLAEKNIKPCKYYSCTHGE